MGSRHGARWAITTVVAAAVVVHAWTDDAALADLTYLGVLVGASVGAWVGALRARPGQRLVPVLIAAGVSCSALGDVLWSWLDPADLNVWVADPAWLASYVLLGAALVTVLVHGRVPGHRDLGFVLDAVTIAVVSVLVVWRASVDAIFADSSVPALVRAVWGAYPILDAVLLALVVRILLSPRARAEIDAWFAVGVGSWLVADVAYLLWPRDEVALTVMDVGWTIGPVLMARAAWTARGRSVEALRRPRAGGWVSQMLIAVSPLLVPPFLELVADLRGEPDDPLQLFAGMVAVIALALVRTGALIRSEELAQRELEVARDAALAASEAKSVFLANISHELRTPLTAMLATGELLEDLAVDDVQRGLVARMRRSGERLRALVESVLDFSRLQSGKVEVQSVAFDLCEVVSEVVDDHLPRAQRRGIRFEWTVDCGVPSVVVGDPLRVFQVLSNLVENAVKFTPQGEVCLRAESDDAADWIRFVVRDTGIGISDDDQVSVFTSFQQVDGSTTRPFEGSGLGLAICRELVELMGGSVTVDSRLGEGSTFVVRLPLPVEQSAGNRVATHP